jgi:hypothetical protein
MRTREFQTDQSAKSISALMYNRLHPT